MGPPPARSASRRVNEAGFALVAVIWAVGILGLLLTTALWGARLRAGEADAIADASAARALADAGAALAVLRVVAQPQGRPFAPPVAIACTLHEGAVALTIEDEGGKLDLNAAAPELLAALLAGAAVPRAEAALAGILDARDAERAAQRAAGSADAEPRPFSSSLEIARVAALDGAALARLAPHLSVHSGAAGLDSRAARGDTLALLAAGGLSGAAPDRLPAAHEAASSAEVFLVRVEARPVAGGRAARDLVVRRDPAAPAAHRVLEARPGTLRALDPRSLDGYRPC